MTPHDVRALRAALGLKQEDLARQLGVTVFTISRWETGHNAPSRLALKALRALQKTRKLAKAG